MSVAAVKSKDVLSKFTSKSRKPVWWELFKKTTVASFVVPHGGGIPIVVEDTSKLELNKAVVVKITEGATM